jgi:hypothetical protein
VNANQASGSSEDKNESTADIENPDEVLVLDGAKLKSLIKDYARDCIREELAAVL